LCRLTFDHHLLRKQVVQMKHAQMFGETALLALLIAYHFHRKQVDEMTQAQVSGVVV
jgi:hypothetical protein